MTLDEAIKHEEEVAKEQEEAAWEAQLQEEYGKIKICKKCEEEHRQLAEWLKDYKRLKEQEPCEGIAKAFQIGLAFGFGEKHDEINKVIDDIKKAITPQQKIGRWILTSDDEYEYCTCSECGYQNGENWMIGSVIKFCQECGAKMVEPQERSDKE